MSRYEIERPPKKIIEDLKKMYSGIIQDACDKVLGLGVRTWMDANLRPIFDEIKLIGPAITLQMVPPSLSSYKGRSGLSLAFEAIDMAQAAAQDVAHDGLVDLIGGELYLDDASPWSLSLVLVIPLAPLNP